VLVAVGGLHVNRDRHVWCGVVTDASGVRSGTNQSLSAATISPGVELFPSHTLSPMSDHIYFGSLEQSERAKMDVRARILSNLLIFILYSFVYFFLHLEQGNSPALSDAIQAGIRAGNINIASAGPQGLDCCHEFEYTFAIFSCFSL
jgi:hypothetical protein